ncbi:MAG: histidine kinase [Actinomycetota bacterium]|nr:histidine kinase [Actinomycetota bacterium]
MPEKNIMSHEHGKKAAADALDGNFDGIFEIYEKKLMDEQNLLITGDGGARELLRGQAFTLVERAASALRGEEEGGTSSLEEEIHQNTEAARMPFMEHPDESFRAGSALCAAAMEVVLEKADLSEEAPEAVVGISLTVHKSVMDHVARVVMASYVDYLLMKIGEIQVEERRHFSRDLHDHIAHSMALVKQNLELFRAMRGKDEAAAEAKLENALETSGKAIQMARDMSMDLRLSETGDPLRLALDNLVRASAPPDVEVEISVSGDEGSVPDRVRDQLYMVMREGLRNAVSHSGGESIRMEVEISDGEVMAAVEDWGDGFDTSSDSADGVGLRSMRERARLMRGSFDITSHPGDGTRAEVQVPLRKRK